MAGLALMLTGRYEWGSPVLALLTLNGVIFLLIRRRLKVSLTPWQRLAPTVASLLGAARQAVVDLPARTELRVLRECFDGLTRRDVLPSLRRRLAWTNAGGLIHLFANILIFYDLHVAEAILARALQSGVALLKGLSALAELEALCSLSCFAWEQADTCYPTPVAEPLLSIRAGRHPLIAHDEAVANDVQLTADTRMWVVTGPNGGGKSTLLRMVGTNIVLAQMGSAVAAQDMTWSPVRLMTDLRVRDSLPKRESYFLSEARHLRRMILSGENEVPLLGLIDEPFRGTNSREKRAASLALVEHLLASDNLFLLATHDIALTEVAIKIPGVENHHFCAELGVHGVAFDYRLRPGPAKVSIALPILEREGYPPAFLARAHKWLACSINRALFLRNDS